MDEVFGALNDPSRRLLLDRLFEHDGQTLGELCEHLPQMTRFGVMNHLGVLEEAGLVATQKVGRSKHHYLNPVPIREIHDRWISKYTQPWVGALAGLKTHLERKEPAMSVPVHVYETYISCEPEAAWAAITDGDQTVQYYYGTRVESTWEADTPVRYLSSDGGVVADGIVLAIDAPQRLELTFHPRWDPDLEAEGPTRMVWLVASENGLTQVRVELYDVAPDSRTYEDFTNGLPFIVAGMKTLLETGEPLRPSVST